MSSKSSGSSSNFNPTATPFVPKAVSPGRLNAVAPPSVPKTASPDRLSAGGSPNYLNPAALPFVPKGGSPSGSSTSSNATGSRRGSSTRLSATAAPFVPKSVSLSSSSISSSATGSPNGSSTDLNATAPPFIPSRGFPSHLGSTDVLVGFSQGEQQQSGHFYYQVSADRNLSNDEDFMPPVLTSNNPDSYEWNKDVFLQHDSLPPTEAYAPQMCGHSSQIYSVQKGLSQMINAAQPYDTNVGIFDTYANGSSVSLDDELPRSGTFYQGMIGQAYINPNTPPVSYYPSRPFIDGYVSQEQYDSLCANTAIPAQPYYYYDTDSASFVYGHQEGIQMRGLRNMDVNAGAPVSNQKIYTRHDDGSNVSVTAPIVREKRKRVSRSKDSVSSNAQVKSFDETIRDHWEQHAKKKAKISRVKGKGKASAESPELNSIAYEHPAEQGDIIGDDGELMHLYEPPGDQLMFSEEEKLYFTELIDGYMAAYSTPIREVNMYHLFNAFRDLRVSHYLTEGPDRSNAELFTLYLAEISTGRTELSPGYEAIYEEAMGHPPGTIRKNEKRLLSESHKAVRSREIDRSLLQTDTTIDLFQDPELMKDLDDGMDAKLVLFKAIKKCYKPDALRLEPFWCPADVWRQSPSAPRQPEDTFAQRPVRDEGVFIDPVLALHPDSVDGCSGARVEVPEDRQFALYWSSEEIFLRGLLKLHLVLYPAAPFDWVRITAAFNKLNSQNGCRGKWRPKMDLRDHFMVMYPQAAALARAGRWGDIQLWEDDSKARKRSDRLQGAT